MCVHIFVGLFFWCLVGPEFSDWLIDGDVACVFAAHWFFVSLSRRSLSCLWFVAVMFLVQFWYLCGGCLILAL